MFPQSGTDKSKSKCYTDCLLRSDNPLLNLWANSRPFCLCNLLYASQDPV